MPYIKQEDRTKFDEILGKLPNFETKGELEYCIFVLMKRFMYERIPSYTNYHDTVYAAMHCAHEYERRYLDAREDVALNKNGDII